eukprot:1256898-Alexandrium_andersonii.AAC.1
MYLHGPGGTPAVIVTPAPGGPGGAVPGAPFPPEEVQGDVAEVAIARCQREALPGGTGELPLATVALEGEQLPGG